MNSAGRPLSISLHPVMLLLALGAGAASAYLIATDKFMLLLLALAAGGVFYLLVQKPGGFAGIVLGISILDFPIRRLLDLEITGVTIRPLDAAVIFC